MKKALISTAALALTLMSGISNAEGFIIVQSTTSTKNSGLYDYLLPQYQEKTGDEIRVVAVGTGQAINNAKNCDGDVLWVHAKSAEEKFIAEGFGDSRADVMYNDFVLVGPATDPAGIKGGNDIVAALKTIAEKQAIFASRGDDSGTHKKERALWTETSVDPTADSGKWYRETGSGMGATLNVGIGMDAYVMTDRATWIKFGNKGQHSIVVEGDDKMFNQYGIILVSSSACENIKAEAGSKFIDWVLSAEGQSLIAGYQVDGQQLFFPNAAN